MIVVDASVAVKWFLVEDGTPEANALLHGKKKLVAPELIKIEVTAGITRRHRTSELSKAEVCQGLRDWSDMIDDAIISLVTHEQDFQPAIELALQLKHPFQDCLYLALAQRLGVPLITADPKFVRRTASFATVVRPLNDMAKLS